MEYTQGYKKTLPRIPVMQVFKNYGLEVTLDSTSPPTLYATFIDVGNPWDDVADNTGVQFIERGVIPAVCFIIIVLALHRLYLLATDFDRSRM